MIFNILTRTSKRPNYFAQHMESIKNQTYDKKLIHNIISCEIGNDITLEYVNQYVNKEDIYGKVTIVFVEYKAPKKGATFPYNLYINEMHKHVLSGYILYLDDDDILSTSDTLNDISNNVEQDKILLFQTKFPNRIYPNDMYFNKKSDKNMLVASCSYVYHTDHLPKLPLWGGNKADDNKFFKSLKDILKIKWYKKILTQLARSSGYGGMGQCDDI